MTDDAEGYSVQGDAAAAEDSGDRDRRFLPVQYRPAHSGWHTVPTTLESFTLRVDRVKWPSAGAKAAGSSDRPPAALRIAGRGSAFDPLPHSIQLRHRLIIEPGAWQDGCTHHNPAAPVAVPSRSPSYQLELLHRTTVYLHLDTSGMGTFPHRSPYSKNGDVRMVEENNNGLGSNSDADELEIDSDLSDADLLVRQAEAGEDQRDLAAFTLANIERYRQLWAL
ncbi:MAG: hypothetical protein Q9203_003611 [Teloschistes exilis]